MDKFFLLWSKHQLKDGDVCLGDGTEAIGPVRRVDGRTQEFPARHGRDAEEVKPRLIAGVECRKNLRDFVDISRNQRHSHTVSGGAIVYTHNHLSHMEHLYFSS